MWTCRIRRCVLVRKTKRWPAGCTSKAFLCRWSSRRCCWHPCAVWCGPVTFPLPKIRSLAYFQPVIPELQQQPLPDGYLDYLRLKFQKAAQRPGD
jgi:hypothetical protein